MDGHDQPRRLTSWDAADGVPIYPVFSTGVLCAAAVGADAGHAAPIAQSERKSLSLSRKALAGTDAVGALDRRQGASPVRPQASDECDRRPGPRFSPRAGLTGRRTEVATYLCDGRQHIVYP